MYAEAAIALGAPAGSVYSPKTIPVERGLSADEVAAMFNNREYGEEMTDEEERGIRASNLVVIFGASDDLAEIRGVIHDEVYVPGGGTIHLSGRGVPVNRCALEFCPYHEEELGSYDKIEALWCEPDNTLPWSYRTHIPHSKFIILEDGELFCEGIVFDFFALTA